MTDMQINIALAEAMGWKPSSKYAVMHDQYQVFRQILTCNKDGTLRKFDYRNPVIFVAICKHWNLDVRFYGFVFAELGTKSYADTPIEKAAALCVIDIVERGVK